MSGHTRLFASCLILLLSLFALGFSSPHAGAASASDFASTNSAIVSAFSSTNSAMQSGGNVSSLVVKLNAALQLVEKAQAENSTDPAQASADLHNAAQIAQQVSAEAPGIRQAGASVRQTQMAESVGGVVAVAIIAALAYIYGGRIYRLAWLFLYRNYVVRPQSG